MNTYIIAHKTKTSTEFHPEYGTFNTVKEAADFIMYDRLDWEMKYFFITLSSEMERIAALKDAAV